jgi:hypothetical protein
MIYPSFTTVKRGNDWMAHVTGNTAVWECGCTEAEAIGFLMLTLSRNLMTS